MKLNRNDLKKLMYDFNGLSNRLLQANYVDYIFVLKKYLKYLYDTEIIADYIKDCGKCEQIMEDEFKAVQGGHGIFDLGESDKEETRNIVAILQYIVDNNVDVVCNLGYAYSNARNMQSILKDFNNRVTFVLISHIEAYLTKIGIDMGVDDKIEYNITVENGQVNIANDNSHINANNVVHFNNITEIEELLNIIQKEAEDSSISKDDQESINNYIEVLREETKKEKPKKRFIKMAIDGLKAIKGTVEFSAAVATLVNIITQML